MYQLLKVLWNGLMVAIMAETGSHEYSKYIVLLYWLHYTTLQHTTLHNNTIKYIYNFVLSSTTVRWLRPAIRMEQKRKAFRVSIGKSARKRQLGRHGRRGEDSVEIRCVCVCVFVCVCVWVLATHLFHLYMFIVWLYSLCLCTNVVYIKALITVF